jgi:hypothetical protein
MARRDRDEAQLPRRAGIAALGATTCYYQAASIAPPPPCGPTNNTTLVRSAPAGCSAGGGHLSAEEAPFVTDEPFVGIGRRPIHYEEVRPMLRGLYDVAGETDTIQIGV